LTAGSDLSASTSLSSGLARRDQQGAVTDHLSKPVQHPVWIARVSDAGCQPIGNPVSLLDSPPAATSRRCEPPVVKGHMHRLASQRWEAPEKSPHLPPMASATSVAFGDPALATKPSANPMAYTDRSNR